MKSALQSAKLVVDDGKGLQTGLILSERYEILAEIGRGGAGMVYKANHLLLKKTQAIKVLHRHLTGDAGSLQRFEVEAQAASALRHENLLTVTDFGLTESNEPFIVMDFIEGKSLANVFQVKKRLSTDEFINIFSQVLKGLEHAHGKGVIHRDIKPSNIMISSEPNAVAHIVDFGIAKILPDDESAAQHLTQTGEIFGSPIYMSPEQCRGGKIDCRSDLYSLGCVMFEALTGEPPVKEGSTVETLYEHISGTIPRINQLHPELNVPCDIEALVARALEKDVEKRYQSASEMLEDLARVNLEKISLPKAADSGQQPRSEANTKPEKSRQSVKVKWLLALVCVLFICIVGFCVYEVLNSKTVDVDVVSPSPEGSFQLNAQDAKVKGKVSGASDLLLLPLTKNTVSWDLMVPENRAGQFAVDAVYACFSDTAGSTLTLKIDNQATGCLETIESTKNWHDFKVHHWKGVLTLPAGPHLLAIDPDTKPEKAMLNLRCLVLNPLTR